MLNGWIESSLLIFLSVCLFCDTSHRDDDKINKSCACPTIRTAFTRFNVWVNVLLRTNVTTHKSPAPANLLCGAILRAYVRSCSRICFAHIAELCGNVDSSSIRGMSKHAGTECYPKGCHYRCYAVEQCSTAAHSTSGIATLWPMNANRTQLRIRLIAGIGTFLRISDGWRRPYIFMNGRDSRFRCFIFLHRVDHFAVPYLVKSAPSLVVRCCV